MLPPLLQPIRNALQELALLLVAGATPTIVDDGIARIRRAVLGNDVQLILEFARRSGVKIDNRHLVAAARDDLDLVAVDALGRAAVLLPDLERATAIKSKIELGL